MDFYPHWITMHGQPHLIYLLLFTLYSSLHTRPVSLSLICSRLLGHWKDGCRKEIRENTRGGNFELKIKCDRKFASGIIYLVGGPFCSCCFCWLQYQHLNAKVDVKNYLHSVLAARFAEFRVGLKQWKCDELPRVIGSNTGTCSRASAGTEGFKLWSARSNEECPWHYFCLPTVTWKKKTVGCIILIFYDFFSGIIIIII